jgi:hypothetical protein
MIREYENLEEKDPSLTVVSASNASITDRTNVNMSNTPTPIHFYPMIGQVGGVSVTKKSVLCCHNPKDKNSSYRNTFVLKPMRDDHRCIREIGCYEIFRILLRLHHNDNNDDNHSLTETRWAGNTTQLNQSLVGIDRYWRILCRTERQSLTNTKSESVASSLSVPIVSVQHVCDIFFPILFISYLTSNQILFVKYRMQNFYV